ncbi:ATP-binding cassette domain-containing protein [Paenibacillus sp. MBLB4367]|uniref:ATP-binding cassette domain-containing protein n=1 Tax=Paenibacillus sp. MBLB4367 TaxID=3384767 RepID=UPI0039083E36
MAEAVLQLINVEKTIRKQKIVEQINLELKPGHVLALCGGNGAGKSTILRMIVGITQPTLGEIRVNGLKWDEDRKGYSEQLGYMPVRLLVRTRTVCGRDIVVLGFPSQGTASCRPRGA